MQESDMDNTNTRVPASTPALGESFSPTTESTADKSSETDPRLKKKLGQLGNNKTADEMTSNASSIPAVAAVAPVRSTSPYASGLRSGSPQPQTVTSIPSSPGRQFQSSPRVHSPAESQIFERNVQEEDSAAVVASPAIPSHIATEDHIPSVLDASSMAITDDHLTPDTVEIVTHTAHLPAAIAVSGSIHGESTLSSPIAEELGQSLDGMDDAAPSYGALDSTDIRRLSFISFADVVHAEQATDGSMRDSLLLSGSALNSPGMRSPSPVRSPTSPLSSSVTSAGDLGKSLVVGPGSPKSLATSLATSSSPTVTGELAIETMRQALRKTGSGDLGAAARSSVGTL